MADEKPKYSLKDPNSDYVEHTNSEIERVRLEAVGYKHVKDDSVKRTQSKPTPGAEKSDPSKETNS